MPRPALVAAIAVALVSTGCTRARVPLSVHETRTFPVAPGKLVKLDVRSLDVHVTVAEAPAISVTIDVSAHASSSAAARRWVERNTPVFDDSPATLEVSQARSRHGIWVFGFLHTEGKLEMTVPPSCRLEVRTSSGDVSIGGEAALPGGVHVHTASGDVKITGGVRELVVNTASGDVRVSGPPLSLVEADTASGDIAVDSELGKGVFETASGDVRAKSVSGDLVANTASGDVSATWTSLPAGAKTRVRTSSGDVLLRFPAGTQLRGEVTTASGRISSDFAGVSDRREHHLTLTGEGSEIEVRTTSGDATLRKVS